MKIRKYIYISMVTCLPLLAVGCSSKNEESADNSIIKEDTSTQNKTDSNNSSKKEHQDAVIYSYSIEDDSLLSKELSLDSITIESLIEALKDAGTVKKDTQILDFKIEEDKYGKSGKLNLSKEYYNYNLGSTSSSGMLDALAQTILANLNIDKLQILIDGQFYEDGHILLDDSFYFTNTSVGNLVGEDLPAN